MDDVKTGGSPVDSSAAEQAFKPTELMPNVVEKVWNQFKDARAHRKQYDKDWGRYYLLYSGRHWDGRQADWMSTPVINLTWSVIQTIVPILTDSRPQVAVVPRQPEHDKIGAVLGSLVEWNWEANDLDILLPKVMTNALIFGNGFMKVLWDPSARGGLGDLKVISVDPSNIFASPYARTFDEADYAIHAENLPKGLVERIYPGSTQPDDSGPEEPSLTLKRDITSQSTGKDRQIHDIRTTTGSEVVSAYGSNNTKDNGQDGLVTVLERWERREDGVYQTVVVNDRLVFDRPSPFDHGRFPFVHFVDHPHTWSLWAMGEVQQVEKLQIEINRRRGHIMDILKFTANPMLVVDPVAGVPYDNLESRPGLVIPVEGGPQAIGWLAPPSVPNALFEVNSLDKQDFDTVLGKVEVLTGKSPAGVESGVAIDMLQEAANVRMRLKVRHMENSIRKLGELMVGIIQQFYTTERVFNIAGQDIFKLEKPVTQDPEAGYMYINQPKGVDPDTGEPIFANEVPPVSEAEFDVRIGPGSTLPVSRATMFQKAITMYQMQVADPEVVWKNSGFPKWREEMERSMAFFQQMAAQQQAMAPEEQGAPPAGPTDQDVDMALESEPMPELPADF